MEDPGMQPTASDYLWAERDRQNKEIEKLKERVELLEHTMDLMVMTVREIVELNKDMMKKIEEEM